MDSGIVQGGVVGSDYDPMLAKVIAHGADRAEALRRLDAALRDTVLLGIGTNIGFLRALVADADVRAARLDTGLVGRRVGDWTAAALPADVLAAAAAHELLELEPPAGAVLVDPFDLPGGWRVGEPAWASWRMFVAGHDPVTVRIRGRAGAAEVVIGDAPAAPVRARGCAHGAGPTRGAVGHLRGRHPALRLRGRAHGTLWLGRDGQAWGIREQAPLEQQLAADPAGGGPVRSPMPGTVTVVEVADGQRVAAGDRLVIVEAMKMEHVLTAPVDGVVRGLRAIAGATVARDAVLLTVEPGGGAEHGPEPERGARGAAGDRRGLRAQGGGPGHRRPLRAGGVPVRDRRARWAQMGLFGLPIPEEYGGMGGDYFALCLALEELARVDSSVAITLEAGVSLGAMPIYRFGTDEQKQEWLPALAAGEKLGAFGLTEPGGGSDAGATRTTARLDGDEWVINGSKAFITNSGTDITSLVTVTAITGGRDVAGRREISAIMVPAGTPGFRVSKKYSKVGWSCLRHPGAVLRRRPGPGVQPGR